jgi:tetratricopeptide (TPR) repeat protein
VPFFAQQPERCAQAALASVLSYHGDPIDPADLERDTFIEEAGGTLTFDLGYCAQRRGFATREIRGAALPALLLWLDSDVPVITLRHVGPSATGLYHYDVLTGYHDGLGVLVRHTGDQPNQVMSYESFVRRWTGWALVVLPPAALDTARSGWRAEQEGRTEEARRLYRKHLARFPADLLVAFNLAGLETPREAIRIYEAILELSPDDGPTLNNLADLLRKMGGDLDRAERLLEHAIEVDPQNEASYRETLDEVRDVRLDSDPSALPQPKQEAANT